MIGAKNMTIIRALFIANIVIQLIFFHIADELKIPLFLTILLLLTFLYSIRRSLILPKMFSVIFSLYIIVYIISSLFSQLPYQSTIEILKQISVFFLVILGFNIFRKDKNSYLQNWYFLILISGFLGLVGILECSNRVNVQKIMPLFEPFHWPTLSANFFLLTAPLTLALFLTEEKTVHRITLFISLALLLTAWILSKNYIGVMIAVNLIIIILYLLEKKSARVIRNILLMVILITLLLPNLLSSFGGNRVPKYIALYQDQFFFGSKEDIVRFSWNSITNNLFTGIGPGAFGTVYRNNLDKPWTWSDFAPNSLLQTLVEIGIGGLLLLMFLFAYLIFLSSKKIIQAVRKKDIYSFAVTSSIICFLFISLFDYSYQIFPLLILFFFQIIYILSEERIITLSTKTAHVSFLPIFLFSLFIFTDAILLNITQRLYTRREYVYSKQILSLLSHKPIPLLNPKIFIWLSAIEVDNNNFEDALEYLYKTKQLDPYNREIDYQIAKFTNLSGEASKAKRILENYIAKNKYAPPKYYFALANFASVEKKLAPSLDWLERASLVYPIDNNGSIFPIYALPVLDSIGYLSPLQNIYFFYYTQSQNKQFLNAFITLSY